MTTFNTHGYLHNVFLTSPARFAVSPVVPIEYTLSSALYALLAPGLATPEELAAREASYGSIVKMLASMVTTD